MAAQSEDPRAPKAADVHQDVAENSDRDPRTTDPPFPDDRGDGKKKENGTNGRKGNGDRFRAYEIAILLVQALCTIALVGLTGFYACYSKRQWQSMEAANQRTDAALKKTDAALAKTDENLRIATDALNETKSQTSTARQALRDAEDGAKAQRDFNKSLLKLNRDQIATSERAYREAERARLSMGQVSRPQITNTEPLCVDFVLVNVGHTAAIDAVVEASIGTGETSQTSKSGLPMLIPPGQPKQVGFCNVTVVGEQWAAKVNDLVYHLEGTVTWKDVYGGTQSFEFCQIYDPGPGGGHWRNQWVDCKMRLHAAQ
jgi:hypothetical protein